MQLRVVAALRFSNAKALQKALDAYEERCYPEYFDASLLTVEGLVVRADTTFEVEADVQFERAFVALCAGSVQASIDLRVVGSPAYRRLEPAKKAVRIEDRRDLTGPGEQWPFGSIAAAHLASWASLPAVKAPRPRKPTGPEPVRSWTLAGPPLSVRALDDGALVAALGGSIAVLRPEGTSQKYDWRTIAGHTHVERVEPMADGTLVGFAPEYGSAGVVFIEPDGKILRSNINSPEGHALAVRAVHPLEGRRVLLVGTRSLAVLEPGHGVLHWRTFGTNDYLDGACVLEGRILVNTSSQVWALDASLQGEPLLASETYVSALVGMKTQAMLLTSVEGKREVSVLDAHGRTLLTHPAPRCAARSARVDVPARVLFTVDSSPHLASVTHLDDGKGWTRPLTHAANTVVFTRGQLAAASTLHLSAGSCTTASVLDRASGELVRTLEGEGDVGGLVSHREGFVGWASGRKGTRALWWPRDEALEPSKLEHAKPLKGALTDRSGRLITWTSEPLVRAWSLEGAHDS